MSAGTGFNQNTGSGGGGGGVQSVNSGTDITVDNTDPANPIVNFTGTYQDPITVVANYSALPAVGTVTGQFYWCSASQGTSWLPGSLGGTYYSAGLYYSNGVSWEFMDVPYQATQSEVNTGTNTNKFVTPATLTSWTGRSLTVGTTAIASGTTTRILYDNAGTLGEYTITGTGTVVVMQTSPSFLTSTALTLTDAVTNAATTIETITHNSSGSIAANFGLSREIKLQSTTTAGRDAGKESWAWSTATDATRTSKYSLSMVSSAGTLTEYYRFNGNGFINLYSAIPGFVFSPNTDDRFIMAYQNARLGLSHQLSPFGQARIFADKIILDCDSSTKVKVGINEASPTAILEILGTTEQQRTKYDASNYYSTTVGSTGGVTFDAVGAGAGFTFSDNVINGALLRLKGYTVATLPAGTQGDTAYCTDLLTPTFLALAVGGGAIVGKVFYNGTQWITA